MHAFRVPSSPGDGTRGGVFFLRYHVANGVAAVMLNLEGFHSNQEEHMKTAATPTQTISNATPVFCAIAPERPRR